MAGKFNIIDGAGSKRAAKVFRDHSLLIQQTLAPAYELEQKTIPFRQYLSIDGTTSGSTDLRVNGATTNVDFWVPAHTDNDRYITIVSFLISDANATLNLFGAITVLTNGCQFFYTSKLTGVQYFHNALKTNFDFIRMCFGQPAVVGGRSNNLFTYITNNATGSSDGVFSTLDLRILMPPFGLKLDHGMDQKLVMRIRDNCSGVDEFTVIVNGFERLPD